MMNQFRVGLLIFIMVTVALLAAVVSPQGLRINQWSLSYWRNSAAGSDSRLEMPLQRHRHAAAWLATEALSRGDLTTAQRFIENASESDDPFVKRSAALISQQNGDVTQALQNWAEIGDIRSLTNAAAAYEQLGRNGDAFDALYAVQDINLKQGTRPLADFLLRQNAPMEAAAVYEEAIKRSPPSSTVLGWYRQLGTIWEKSEEWERASDLYEDMVALDPVEGSIRLAWLAYKSGKGMDEALAYFDEAIATGSSGAGYYEKAQLLAREARFSEADKLYILALQRNPDQKEWWLALARNARQTGDLETALLRFQDIIRRFPDYADAYHDLAEVYRSSGMLEEAIRASEASITYAAKPSVAYYMRTAALYESVGDQQAAANYFRQVLALEPANKGAADALQRIEKNP